MIHRKVFLNSVLRSMLTSYLLLSIATLLSVTNMRFDNSGNAVSSVFSMFILVFIFVFPAAVFYFLKRYALRLADEDFEGRFGTLYLNIRVDDPKARLLTVLFIMRRLLFAISIVLFA